jgi:DNA topoisomerase IA
MNATDYKVYAQVPSPPLRTTRLKLLTEMDALGIPAETTSVSLTNLVKNGYVSRTMETVQHPERGVVRRTYYSKTGKIPPARPSDRKGDGWMPMSA